MDVNSESKEFKRVPQPGQRLREVLQFFLLQPARLGDKGDPAPQQPAPPGWRLLFSIRQHRSRWLGAGLKERRSDVPKDLKQRVWELWGAQRAATLAPPNLGVLHELTRRRQSQVVSQRTSGTATAARECSGSVAHWRNEVAAKGPLNLQAISGRLFSEYIVPDSPKPLSQGIVRALRTDAAAVLEVAHKGQEVFHTKSAFRRPGRPGRRWRPRRPNRTEKAQDVRSDGFGLRNEVLVPASRAHQHGPIIPQCLLRRLPLRWAERPASHRGEWCLRRCTRSVHVAETSAVARARCPTCAPGNLHRF